MPRAKLAQIILAFVMQTAIWGFSCMVVFCSYAFGAGEEGVGLKDVPQEKRREASGEGQECTSTGACW